MYLATSVNILYALCVTENHSKSWSAGKTLSVPVQLNYMAMVHTFSETYYKLKTKLTMVGKYSSSEKINFPVTFNGFGNQTTSLCPSTSDGARPYDTHDRHG